MLKIGSKFFLIVLSIFSTMVESKLNCCSEYWPNGENKIGVPCDYTSMSCHNNPFASHVIIQPGWCCESDGKSDIEEEAFTSCVKSYGYKPVNYSDIFFQFQFLAKSLGGDYEAKELWMMIGEMAKESEGFSATREKGCFGTTPIPDRCKYKQCDNYPPGYYYGRGYIQLTHCSNYRDASKDLFGDDRLVRDPDLVARDPAISMATAVWFWAKNVHKRSGVQDGDFGAATKAVMGSGACKGQAKEAKNRYKFLMKCLDGANKADIKSQINEKGCYSRKLTRRLKLLGKSLFYTPEVKIKIMAES